MEQPHHEGREKPMIVRWLLFEARLVVVLTNLERKVGLAIVQAKWLAAQTAGEPKAVSKAR
jgi:hypothetical protein